MTVQMSDLCGNKAGVSAIGLISTRKTCIGSHLAKWSFNLLFLKAIFCSVLKTDIVNDLNL